MQWPSDHTGNHFPLCYDFVWLNHLISFVLALQNKVYPTHLVTSTFLCCFWNPLTPRWCVDKDTESHKIAKLHKRSIQSAACLVWVGRPFSCFLVNDRTEAEDKHWRCGDPVFHSWSHSVMSLTNHDEFTRKQHGHIQILHKEKKKAQCRRPSSPLLKLSSFAQNPLKLPLHC